MALDSEGCKVQHLTFASVPAMLDHFKTNSIPLESIWLNDDVKLTKYIDWHASDNFRTTIVLNVDQLNRVPPRRTRSLHFGMSHSVTNGAPMSPDSQGSMAENRGRSGSSSSSSMNSLLHNRTSSGSGWRQIFNTQRSSSAGNMGRVQRSNSQNADSMQRTRRRGQNSSSENNYVCRNY